jgi:Tfp pilus assembly protein PilZ
MGTKLTFALFLPGSDDPVCVDGVVRWVRNWSAETDAAPGIGVQFEGLSEEDGQRVRDFMDQRAPLFHDS